jgi:D-alanine-D-alanine ligase
MEAFLAETRAGTAAVTCPLVVKPSRQGSTIGISIVRDRADRAAALDTALAYDADVLVEKFVEGMEITGPVLGNEELECLPLVEIVPNDGFYDYEAKYTPGATDEIVPARLSPEQTRAAQELAVRAHQALGCRGVSRTDMLVADDGIWVLEVNTIPGMTPTSLLPRSAEAAGIPFSALLDRMIELALEGRTVEPTTAARP